MKKRILSALLILCMMLTLLPTTVLAAELPEDQTGLSGQETDETTAPEDEETDYILNGLGDKVELSYPTELRPGSRPSRAPGVISETLPESYISEAAQSVPVRDQGGYGLCWAFASYAALETWMKQKGITGDFNFSELHMGYATSTSGGNTEKGFSGRPDPDSAGGRTEASAYLMRGPELNGAVNEAADPYTYNASTSPTMPVRPVSETSGKSPSYTVSNILYLTSNQTSSKDRTEIIKRYIMSQGGVASTFWSEKLGTNSINTGNSPYFNNEHKAYNYDLATNEFE